MPYKEPMHVIVLPQVASVLIICVVFETMEDDALAEGEEVLLLTKQSVAFVILVVVRGEEIWFLTDESIGDAAIEAELVLLLVDELVTVCKEVTPV